MEKFNSDGTPQNEGGKNRKKRKFPVWILLILVVAAGLSSVVVLYGNGHFTVTTPDYFVLRHVGNGVFRCVIHNRINSILRICHGIT